MFPLLLCLFSEYNVGKIPALNLRQIDAISNQGLHPIFIIFKRQIQNESS